MLQRQPIFVAKVIQLSVVSEGGATFEFGEASFLYLLPLLADASARGIHLCV
jgi:hypothetical protein